MAREEYSLRYGFFCACSIIGSPFLSYGYRQSTATIQHVIFPGYFLLDLIYFVDTELSTIDFPVFYLQQQCVSLQYYLNSQAKEQSLLKTGDSTEQREVNSTEQRAAINRFAPDVRCCIIGLQKEQLVCLAAMEAAMWIGWGIRLAADQRPKAGEILFLSASLTSMPRRLLQPDQDHQHGHKLIPATG